MKFYFFSLAGGAIDLGGDAVGVVGDVGGNVVGAVGDAVGGVGKIIVLLMYTWSISIIYIDL